MEKKTIGGFIAALRKANGMTQKELAERLNVSDKTISRWERDDGAPDLSAIPVLAEIFDVTCDELLSGSRRSPAERVGIPEEGSSTPKGEKQRRRLLNVSLSKYKTHTYITMGISVLGLIAAAICNIAFLRSYLGFLFGAAFYAASAVCQAVFWNNAVLSIAEESVADTAVNEWKRTAVRLTQRSIGVTVALFGFTTPLLLGDTYSGLVESWPLFGAIGAAAFLLIYAVVCYFLNASFIKKGVYRLDEKEAEIYHRNHRLKRTCAVGLTVSLLVTFIGHQVTTSIWGPWSIMCGTTFHDYESFIAYMEQDIPYESLFGDDYSYAVDVPVSSAQTGDTTYYDEYGNEISEEDALRRTLEDKNGNVVCEYIDRNESVTSLRYTPQDGTVLPITVCTYDDLQEAREKVARRNVIFCAAYCVEAAAVLLFYFKKRAK